MRLGITIYLLVLVSACAQSGGEPAPAPARHPTEVTLVSMSNAGGEQLGAELAPLTRKQEVRRFLAGFDAAFRPKLRRTIGAYDVPEGYQLTGAVAYVGCGTPDDATVGGEGSHARLVPGETHDENIDCLAAVTTVGIVAMPMPRQ